MSSWLFCASLFFAVGPVVDPIDGEYLTTEDRDLLPGARHLGAVADLWMVGIVNMQSSGAGIELFDSLMLSAHGRGWSQLTYYINGVDQTDPARPGMPLFDVPHLAWDWIAFNSLWTDQPGFTWRFEPGAEGPARVRVAGSLGGNIGGPVWVPRGFDRDPAYAFGAPTDRRSLREARELTVSTQVPVPWGTARVFGELLAHDHHYLTLPVPDLADRETVMMAMRIDRTPWPIDVTAGWQRRHRDHEGAQARWPEAFTQDALGETMFAQAESSGPVGRAGFLTLALGGGWRRDQSTAHGNEPWVQDLADAWLMQLRPTYPAVTERWQVGGEVRWSSVERGPIELYLRGRFAGVRREPDVVAGVAGLTYAGQGVSQTLFTNVPAESIWLRNVRAGLDWTLPMREVWVQLTAGVDLSAVGDPVRGMMLDQWGPALGVAARWPVGGGELFGLVRREPEAVTAQVGDFLSADTPSGNIVAWDDINGDSIPTPNERGIQLGRTGGAFHALDGNLLRPSSNALAIGYRTPTFGPFRFTISGVGRWLLDRYSVDTPNVSTTPVAFHDPGGDGRGEVRAPEGGQDFQVGAVDPASQSEATYLLTNAEKVSYYLGLETSLVTENTHWWFVNLGATAYLSAGGAPFGNGPDRNDPGIVDESSAGFNNAFKSWSRYDHDRSFAVKLMTGIMPVEGLSLAIAARYRDGQPFTRIVVDADLPQGDTALMAIRRGGSRYTFHMTWDLRVRYSYMKMAPFYVTAWADLFNVFNSGTELLEDPRTGPTYRRSIEAVPGRAGLVTLEVGWL